jgi:hypothetical protein
LETDWKEIELETASLRLRSPEELRDVGATGIDSQVTSLEGPTLSVTVDTGPYADPLSSYAGRPEYMASHETIGGRRARVVSFRLEDDRRFAGAHFEPAPGGAGPDRATVSVVEQAGDGTDVPLEVVRSVEFI